jgi:HSP20 family protein
MTKPTTALEKTPPEVQQRPMLVEAEKMFEHFADVSREIANRAFTFFEERGRDWGNHLDDWFRAETELLRPTPVEITESEGLIKVRAELPGFRPDEIELSVKDDVLFMKGRSGTELKSEDEKTFYTERRSNQFCRQLTLPGPVETDGLNAELKDGILTLELKRIEEKEASKIEINAT